MFRPAAHLSASCPGPRDLGWRLPGALGRGGAVDRVRAGQAACAGGPVAASKRFIHSCSRCHSPGRCKVISPRPRRASRAATVDEVAAQCGAAGFAAGEAGQASGGAQQVVADGCEGKPGRVGGERARGQVSQRPVSPVREDLLHLGVVAVLGLGLQQGERGVGEDGVGSARRGTVHPGRRRPAG